MKTLIDMNLSPAWVSVFQAAGHDDRVLRSRDAARGLGSASFSYDVCPVRGSSSGSTRRTWRQTPP